MSPRRFDGTVFNLALDEVRALVAAARENGEATFTILNGIGLIADPWAIDPDYIEQLVWTYDLVKDVGDREVIGRRHFYQNLVPELQALAAVLLKEFSRLNLDDERAVVAWLVRFMPVSWCRWARPQGEDERRILAGLAGSSSRLVREAKILLASMHLMLT